MLINQWFYCVFATWSRPMGRSCRTVRRDGLRSDLLDQTFLLDHFCSTKLFCSTVFARPNFFARPLFFKRFFFARLFFAVSKIWLLPSTSMIEAAAILLLGVESSTRSPRQTQSGLILPVAGSGGRALAVCMERQLRLPGGLKIMKQYTRSIQVH